MNSKIYNFEDLKNAFPNANFVGNKDISINNIQFNSKQCTNGTMFFALQGSTDGHLYIQNAIENGANAIVCVKLPDEINEKVLYIQVKDTKQSLIELAKFNRSRIKGKVIAITGSVGKTSVKEFILNGLKTFSNNVFATYGNFNNDIGMPLTIANTPKDTEFLILEMGTNHIGEIDFLTKIAKPDVAIITTITNAHLGNFDDKIENLIQAKCEIFNGLKKDGKIILNKNCKFYDKIVENVINKGFSTKNIITIGAEKTNADFELSNTKRVENDYKIQGILTKNSEKINISVKGYSEKRLFNSLFAFAVADCLGFDCKKIAESIENVEIPTGRGNFEEIVYKDKKIKLINDAYNSSPDALYEALHSLSFWKENKVAIVGDMLELGETSAFFHSSVAEKIVENGINTAIFVGENMKYAFDKMQKDFSKENVENHYFSNIEDLLKNLYDLIPNNSVVLLKASLGMNFKKIINFLQNN